MAKGCGFVRRIQAPPKFISELDLERPWRPFPPEKDRYHLYVSYACPWAHRALITRKLKGLESIITFSSVHWDLDSNGWRFVRRDENVPGEFTLPDPIPGHEDFTHLRQIYFESDPEYEGRFTVPILYDKKTKTIFDDLLPTKHREVHLYPESLRTQIDEANVWIYDDINNGVYKSGFATTQEAHERNVLSLFKALDKAEAHLAAQQDGPYYSGEHLTEIDIRL
ncbi:glutathione S-transferase [Colletotrichum tofieldiae]|nr:glutathione S-transferase [Colletotrichum tofieldiae]